jgi:tetratricopeptide (TPR) repeat protein
MAASGGATGAAAPASDAPGAAEPAAQGNSASRTTARAGAPADPMREAMSLLFAARAAAATGRLQQAADAYQASATAHAGNFMALEELGNLYLYGLREPAKAAEAYNQAAERLARVGHWGRALQLRRWVSSLAARAGEPDQP